MGTGLPFGGRWLGYQAKRRLEDCTVLRSDMLSKAGVLKRPEREGTLAYRPSDRAEPVGRLDWYLERLGDDLFLEIETRSGPGAGLRQMIPLDTTRLASGGARLWLRCPGAGTPEPCRARVGALYLPTGGRRYACKNCHHLAYGSTQEPMSRRSLMHLVAGRMRIAVGGARWLLKRPRVPGWSG